MARATSDPIVVRAGNNIFTALAGIAALVTLMAFVVIVLRYNYVLDKSILDAFMGN